MALEPVIINVTRTGAGAELQVRSGHTILAGPITVEELDRLATLFQAEAVELRQARNRRSTPDYYCLLGVARTATAEEIQSAYRARAKQFHPDTSAHATTAAMQQLNEAYETLSDQDKRRQYDRTL